MKKKYFLVLIVLILNFNKLYSMEYIENLDQDDREFLQITENKYKDIMSDFDMQDFSAQKWVVDNFKPIVNFKYFKKVVHHICNYCMLKEELNPECGAYPKTEALEVEKNILKLWESIN